MAVYAYIATEAQHRAPVRGTIAADSARSARDQLRARGLAIQDVTEQSAARRSGMVERYLRRRQSVYVTGLLQEMATLLAAGIPLLDALDTITRQHAGRFQACILMLRDHVAAGGGLADAMGRQPELFDPLCLNIVEVGENTGTLDAALEQLVAYRQRNATLRNRVAAALMYPGIVLLVGMGVSIFLMTFVVPNLLNVLLDSGRPLPFATTVVKGVSDLLLAWWWLMLLLVVAGAMGVRAVMRLDRVGFAWHRLQLHIPVFGDLLRKQSIARMAMVMAALLKSGVVFVKAVRIAQGTVSNRVLRQALIDCEQAVFAGNDIAVALEKTDAFPPLVVQVFAVGQASGRLETMLENLSNDYDVQVQLATGRLTALLEPIMMIGLAIFVGFIAFATILPILEAGNVL